MNTKRMLLIIILISLSFSAISKNKVIDFKLYKSLKSNEGLVVLVIDINFRISKISVGKEGKIFPVYSFKKLKPGTQMRIIKLKEGAYFWKEGIGRTGNTTYTFDIDKERTSFTVKAGKLNYPGTLQFRGWKEGDDVVFSHNMLNNSSIIAEELDKNYDEIIKKYSLIYSGLKPDPFLEFNDQLDNN